MNNLEIREESTDTRLKVTTTVPAPVEDVWDLLRRPSSHAEIDGSGMIRAAVGQEPIEYVDQMFVMEMLWTDGTTRYRTDNYVTRYDPERCIEWLVADEGQDPAGWKWGWLLQTAPDNSTRVTNYCDWTEVTDQEVLDQKGFPLVDASKVQATLRNLANALS
ncbi:hypothetical protein [Kocuria coralli]|nr:hypothetical protein [Kocuria coralli]